MDKIKTAIIGCGKVAHLHAAALKNLPQSEFTAVWSRTASRAEEFAAQYNVKAYKDIGEMIKTTGIQAVLVCTAHPFHAGPAIEAMSHGAHVLVEKPLASSLQDCDSMLQKAAETGLKFGMISQRRFYQPCKRIRQAIDDGRIGKPVLGTATIFGWRGKDYYDSDPWRGSWRDEGGGILVNQSPHQLDLLQWYMGEIDEVFGYWANFNHPYIEVEDTAD